MYSIILATMLTTGAATPDFGRHGCHGCHGCYGCCGGCYGCCGGCYGCCGGCYGCCGGCYGCCGGCWGGWSSCYGCCGGCWGGWSSCYGCCGGCFGCCGGCYGGVALAPAVAVPVAPVMPTLPVAPKKTATLSNAGAVVLKAPANVQLSIEGQNIPRTTSEETFRTPELEPGSAYTYTIRATVVREGKTVAFTKQVKVRAGQTSEADFTKLVTAGKDVARVTVKLPAEARLYVDGVACPLTSATRSFNTPELEAGRTYYYTLKAELTDDGEKRIATKRVVVEAGKQVTVEFQDLSVVSASR